jgi:ribosomal-protein-alanine N-acetyltransferase
MNETMELLPIKETPGENEELINHPLCQEAVNMTIGFYKKVGFIQPWIGYIAQQDGEFVGAAGFKGRPINGAIEIAYGTFDKYQKKGIGTEICRQLVELSLRTDPSIKITARTLPEKNYSTRILEKNSFIFNGTVNDRRMETCGSGFLKRVNKMGIISLHKKLFTFQYARKYRVGMNDHFAKECISPGKPFAGKF